MAYDIEVVELNPQPVMVMEAEVAPPEIGAALGRMLPAVHGYVTELGGQIVGMPFLRYLDMSDRFRIEAGIPVATKLASRDDILAKELPGGRTATALSLGEYHLVGQAWDAVYAWCAEQGIESRFGGWDVYENDPTEVASSSELRTRLYLPLT